MSEPAKEVEQEGAPPAQAEPVVEKADQPLSEAAKKRQKKKKKQAAIEKVEVTQVDYWSAPIDVDPDAMKSNSKEFEKGTLKEYDFWKGQPVPQFSDEVSAKNEAIHQPLPLPEVQKEPYTLNSVLEWSYLDILNEAEMDELYDLLNQNYVEDAGCTFRFDYSREFLRWALSPPGWLRKWHLGVRAKQNKKLVAFISAIPANLRSYN